jgi:hypothetical protein
MKITSKNLMVLDSLLRIYHEREIPGCAVRSAERYHLNRLVKAGFLRRRKAGDVGSVYVVDDTCKPIKDYFPWAGMNNRRMQEKLVTGRAIDLSNCERSAAGEYLLGIVSAETLAEVRRLARIGFSSSEVVARDKCNCFVEGKDYCDARTEQWIWSVGVHRETGQVWASCQSNKYLNPAFICIWLR